MYWQLFTCLPLPIQFTDCTASRVLKETPFCFAHVAVQSLHSLHSPIAQSEILIVPLEIFHIFSLRVFGMHVCIFNGVLYPQTVTCISLNHVNYSSQIIIKSGACLCICRPYSCMNINDVLIIDYGALRIESRMFCWNYVIIFELLCLWFSFDNIFYALPVGTNINK